MGNSIQLQRLTYYTPLPKKIKKSKKKKEKKRKRKPKNPIKINLKNVELSQKSQIAHTVLLWVIYYRHKHIV